MRKQTPQSADLIGDLKKALAERMLNAGTVTIISMPKPENRADTPEGLMEPSPQGSAQARSGADRQVPVPRHRFRRQDHRVLRSRHEHPDVQATSVSCAADLFAPDLV